MNDIISSSQSKNKKLVKIIHILLIVTLAGSCNGQNPNPEMELEKILNENIQIIEYDRNEYNSTLKINMEDSVMIYRSPMSSLEEKKYDKNRNQYKVMPIVNLHPSGMFYDPEKNLVKIYPRKNKPGFYDNITSNNKVRWKNGEFDSDVCTIKMNDKFNSEKFEQLQRSYSNFIKANNKDILADEPAPKEGVKRPEYKSYRNRVLNLKSKLEQSDFVLPTHTTTTKPTIRDLTFEKSITYFEREILDSLIKSNVELKGNLRGFILINRNGEVIEVLQEESENNFSKKNEKFEELALKYTGWSAAKHKEKEVICKVKYYIQKKDWD